MSAMCFNPDAIQTLLTAETKAFFPITETLSEVTSTNDYLLHKSQLTPPNIICFAEKQTLGRGRRGQRWISNDKDITFSVLWHTQVGLEKLAGGSLVIALAVVKALQASIPKVEFKVKWPNDIFYQNKKLAGILIESTKNNNANAMIIGIGINVKDDTKKKKLNNAYACLHDLAPHPIPYENIIANIINEIQINLQQFEQHGLEQFIGVWKQYDYCHNQAITVETNQREISGVSQGINANGELILSLANDETILIHSGKIEYLKPAT